MSRYNNIKICNFNNAGNQESIGSLSVLTAARVDYCRWWIATRINAGPRIVWCFCCTILWMACYRHSMVAFLRSCRLPKSIQLFINFSLAGVRVGHRTHRMPDGHYGVFTPRLLSDGRIHALSFLPAVRYAVLTVSRDTTVIMDLHVACGWSTRGGFVRQNVGVDEYSCLRWARLVLGRVNNYMFSWP